MLRILLDRVVLLCLRQVKKWLLNRSSGLLHTQVGGRLWDRGSHSLHWRRMCQLIGGRILLEGWEQATAVDGHAGDGESSDRRAIWVVKGRVGRCDCRNCCQ